MALKYKKALLKISGETFAGQSGFGFDIKKALNVAGMLKGCSDLGVCIGAVVGGGNFLRGRTSNGMDKANADYMGMLSTIINALGLLDACTQIGLEAKVQTALHISSVAEPYVRERALSHLKKGRVVIFAGGTGNPFFSTDTCAGLRAAEIGAEIILKSTSVDGVYDSDPKINPNAKKYETITADEILSKDLKIIDGAAASMCRESKIPWLIFSKENPENIILALKGEKIGTLITP